MDKWGIQISNWVENIMGKGEITRYEQFLLFPKCFQRLPVVDVSKMSIYGVKVKIFPWYYEEKKFSGFISEMNVLT